MRITNFFNVGGSFVLSAGVSIAFFGEEWDLNMSWFSIQSLGVFFFAYVDGVFEGFLAVGRRFPAEIFVVGVI